MKTTLAAVIAVFLFMGAMCDKVDIPAFIAAVQTNAVNLCGFMPLADFINAVLQTNEAAAVVSMGANGFAHLVCDRVGVPPVPGTVAAGPAPTISGIPIQGHYVVK